MIQKHGRIRSEFYQFANGPAHLACLLLQKCTKGQGKPNFRVRNSNTVLEQFKHMTAEEILEVCCGLAAADVYFVYASCLTCATSLFSLAPTNSLTQTIGRLCNAAQVCNAAQETMESLGLHDVGARARPSYIALGPRVALHHNNATLLLIIWLSCLVPSVHRPMRLLERSHLHSCPTV